MNELTRRFAGMVGGVLAYRNHPRRRQSAWRHDAVVWTEGTSRLLAYRSTGAAQPVFVVPSLVNRGYILDLDEDNSFVRWLSGRGHTVFLMDWDAPGDVERKFGLSEYVARLERAWRSVADPAPPAVLGYCMGGNLALGLALRLGELAPDLALLATPWDFHADDADGARSLAGILPCVEPLLETLGELPLDVINGLFATLDPLLAYRKFQRFSGFDENSDAAKRFVVLEDWLNDGMPLAAPVARECLSGWYGENTPAAGNWRLDGTVVDPSQYTGRSLAVIPGADRIVPPASATALAASLPGCRVARPKAGHIGMIASRSARTAVWPEIAAFLADG